jgi:hypothetical protein
MTSCLQFHQIGSRLALLAADEWDFAPCRLHFHLTRVLANAGRAAGGHHSQPPAELQPATV